MTREKGQKTTPKPEKKVRVCVKRACKFKLSKESKPHKQGAVLEVPESVLEKYPNVLELAPVENADAEESKAPLKGAPEKSLEQPTK